MSEGEVGQGIINLVMAVYDSILGEVNGLQLALTGGCNNRKRRMLLSSQSNKRGMTHLAASSTASQTICTPTALRLFLERFSTDRGLLSERVSVDVKRGYSDTYVHLGR
jgi:hypothetical protein